jgi:hypothetical protein
LVVALPLLSSPCRVPARGSRGESVESGTFQRTGPHRRRSPRPSWKVCGSSGSADGKPERLSGLAAELVRLRLEVLVGAATPEAQALMHATTTTPIVFGASVDPVEAGLVASLARPGGNVTGPLLAFDEAFSGKWVELLKAAVPKVTRVAVLVPVSEVLPGWPGHSGTAAVGSARGAWPVTMWWTVISVPDRLE